MDITSIVTEIGKGISTEIAKEFGTNDVRSLLIGKDSILKDIINNEIWVGNYRISIKAK